MGLNGSDYTPASGTGPAIGLGPSGFVDGGHLDTWFAGAQIPLGAGRIVLQASLARPSWRAGSGAGRAPLAQVETVGYILDLSPRTSVYTYVGQLRHTDLDNGYDQEAGRTMRVAAGISQQF